VLALKEEGLNNCAIARRTGIPRATVRDWVRGLVPRVHDRGRNDQSLEVCPRCGNVVDALDETRREAYAYLLGLYLGDGSISQGRRNVFRLRVTLDSRYPGIIGECVRAMRHVLPRNRVLVQKRPTSNCVDVGVWSKHLTCLFPQHGPGPKHERSIVLADWQEEIIARWTPSFLRGLIHSDGCRFSNPVRVKGKLCTYSRYNFSNASEDIRSLFCDACDRLGIEWRQMNARNISVARRVSVARLDAFVGPKA
jgi:hypothetical protein